MGQRWYKTTGEYLFFSGKLIANHVQILFEQDHASS
jgi:hypothetical protein